MLVERTQKSISKRRAGDSITIHPILEGILNPHPSLICRPYGAVLKKRVKKTIKANKLHRIKNKLKSCTGYSEGLFFLEYFVLSLNVLALLNLPAFFATGFLLLGFCFLTI